jgi:hypothetical protein
MAIGGEEGCGSVGAFGASSFPANALQEVTIGAIEAEGRIREWGRDACGGEGYAFEVTVNSASGGMRS